MLGDASKLIPYRKLTSNIERIDYICIRTQFASCLLCIDRILAVFPAQPSLAALFTKYD